jgi:hypothetical protein
MKTSIFLVLTLTSSAFADFSYTSTAKMPAGMGGASSVTRHYFKGQKMKMELPASSIIVDFEAGTQTIINPGAKTYTVHKIGENSALGKQGAEMDMKMDVKETGESKVINGFQTREAVITMDSEVTIPGRGPMKSQMEMHLWIARDIPGASELKAFYERNAKGYAGMMGSGAQKAMLDAQRKVASLGGVPVLTVTKMKMPSMGGGISDTQSAQMSAGMAQAQTTARARLEEMAKQGGPQGDMAKQQLARMGGGAPMGGIGAGTIDTTSEASEFSSSGIPDSVFAVPAGYQKVDR